MREQGDEAFTDENTDVVTKKEEKKRFMTKNDLVSVILAILVTVIVRVFIIDIAVVEGSSMEATIHDGDRVLYMKLGAEPVSGKIAIVDAGQHVLIKRVIATEGETIEIKEGKVYIDGILLQEDYLNEEPVTEYYPLTELGEGEFFAMGDNRNHSSDSRVYGIFNATEHFKGNVMARFEFFKSWENL